LLRDHRTDASNVGLARLLAIGYDTTRRRLPGGRVKFDSGQSSSNASPREMQYGGDRRRLAMPDTRFDSSWKRPEIRHNVPTEWNWVVAHPGNLELGTKSDIGAFTYIQARYGIEIQENVQIGSHCSIYSISTISPTGHPIIGKVTIKKGAQIGAHSTIMPGVTIGEGAIVGAYSFVREDVPPGSTVVGIPAKIQAKTRTHERQRK